jgi:hypothetical protein
MGHRLCLDFKGTYLCTKVMKAIAIIEKVTSEKTVGPLYHGTTAPPFSVFKQSEDPERMNIGFHFGSMEQARYRAGENGMIIKAKLRGSFIRTPDMGGFEPHSIAEWMESKGWVDSQFVNDVVSGLSGPVSSVTYWDSLVKTLKDTYKMLIGKIEN